MWITFKDKKIKVKQNVCSTFQFIVIFCNNKMYVHLKKKMTTKQ